MYVIKLICFSLLILYYVCIYLVNDMKNSWHHIRDNCSKFIHQGKSGDDWSSKKNVYADALDFLQENI